MMCDTRHDDQPMLDQSFEVRSWYKMLGPKVLHPQFGTITRQTSPPQLRTSNRNKQKTHRLHHLGRSNSSSGSSSSSMITRKSNLSKAALFLAAYLLSFPDHVQAAQYGAAGTGGNYSQVSWQGGNETTTSSPTSWSESTNLFSSRTNAPTKAPTDDNPSTAAPTSTPTSDALILPIIPATLTCPTILTKSTEIDPASTLHYEIVPSNPPGSTNGLLCGRLETKSHDGWVGLALSRNLVMPRSEAIIGIPMDDSVLKYDLSSYDAAGGITVMEEDKQTLRDASIDITEDGTTIMEFAKLLVEDDEIPIMEEGVNIFLYARGGDFLGLHWYRRSYKKDFAEDNFVPVLSCPDVLSMSTVLENMNATLHYAIVPSNPPESRNGVLCGRLEAKHDGYIGIAFSRTTSMLGAEAIIGLPSDDSVLKYNMNDYNDGDVVPMREDRQTLRDTSFDMNEDGMTIMEFTKLLVEDWQIPILEEGENIFLYAAGGYELGAHSAHLSFTKDFAEDIRVPSVEEEGGELELLAKDCTKELCDLELDSDYLLRYKLNIPEDSSAVECTGCTISMELIYEGEAWISIAFSNDGKMVGSEAVGTPVDGNVLKYIMESKVMSGVERMPESQQTLMDASIEVTDDGQTIMKFTKLMREPGEIEILTGDDNYFLGAYGIDEVLATHIKRHSVVLNLASGVSEEVATPYKAAWLAHGIMAFLSWGVFVPFAVQASVLRAFLPKGSTWIKLHKAFNFIAYALFILIFIIGVVYTSMEGGSHFVNGHQKMGLAMLIMAFGQILAGVFRPPNPAPGEAKAAIRVAWEVGHRVLGVALLACGFWQMDSGIGLYATKYSVSESDESNLSIAYWIWIGVMSAVIIFGGLYFNYLVSSGESPVQVAEKEDGDVTARESPLVDDSENSGKKDQDV